MDADITKARWVERFALHLGTLGVPLTPEELLDFALDQWQTSGHLSPEAVAESEFAAGGFDPHASD
jgi:hypothetical protein